MPHVLLGWTGRAASWKRQFWDNWRDLNLYWPFDDMKELLCVIKLRNRMFLFLEMQTQVFQGGTL